MRMCNKRETYNTKNGGEETCMNGYEKRFNAQGSKLVMKLHKRNPGNFVKTPSCFASPFFLLDSV